MNRLKVSDLSFFETELQNESSVQGGIFRRVALHPYSGVMEDDIVPDDMYYEKFIVDENTGGTGYVVYKKTDNSLTAVGILQSSENINSISLRAFAYSANSD